MEYYRALTDGEGEALLLKARTEASRLVGGAVKGMGR